jgi:entry exclusion lipoprotein TrbK
MKKQTTWLLAILTALLLAACADQKAPAQKAVAAAESALAAIQDTAQKYAPDQLQAVQAQLQGVKDAIAKGDFSGAMAAIPALNSAISSLKDTSDAKAKDAEAAAAAAKDTWGPLSTDVPNMVGAIQSRVDILSKSHHLPHGVTKDTLASAKSGLDSLKSGWADASNAASSGDYVNAVSKAQALKAQAADIMKALGMSASS